MRFTLQVEFCDLGSVGTSQRKIDKVLIHMLECGKPNFLDEFIVCLKLSNDGTGGAHEELADSLEAAYRSEMAREFASPQNGMFYFIIIIIDCRYYSVYLTLSIVL